jgi:hypothetical protein
MSKSQNTKDEQQKDLCITSEQLTEQWNKGKLPDGFYWVEFQDGEILPTTFSNQHGFICCDSLCDEENIKQILAKMPSYKEYQQLLSDQLAKNEGVEINAELEAENTKLKRLLDINNVLNIGSRAIYARLKENTTGEQNKLYADMFDNIEKMIAKINQVLGEK